MITVSTVKPVKESADDGNVVLQSSDSSLLNKFVNEYTDYSIEPLKAGTYDAIFSRETFDDGVPIFKVFDRYDRDGSYAGDVWNITLVLSNDVPVAKGENKLGLEECWVPCEGGWAWINFMPSRDEIRKLSKEGQEEVKNGEYALSRQYGSFADRVVIKRLLEFEKYITQGKYFNGNSILSDKAFITSAFNACANGAASEYPGVTMTMTDADVYYQLVGLYEEGAMDYLQLVFDVTCKDSSGDSFEATLYGHIYVGYPEDGFVYDYLSRS